MQSLGHKKKKRRNTQLYNPTRYLEMISSSLPEDLLEMYNMSPTTRNIPKANGMFRGVGAYCIDDMVIDSPVGHRCFLKTERKINCLNRRFAELVFGGRFADAPRSLRDSGCWT
jgi:hypothetical protein